MWRSCRTRVASDKSGTLSPSCLLLVEMEKGGRGGALYLKSKLSLASLEKLGALFSKLFFPKVKLKNPKIPGDQEGTETGDDHLDEATLLLVHLGHSLHWLLKVGPGRFLKVYNISKSTSHQIQTPQIRDSLTFSLMILAWVAFVIWICFEMGS